jgi:lipid II:glycine glycyltransferase (peptidoglycan interpeptide bridge formation enzyme)
MYTVKIIEAEMWDTFVKKQPYTFFVQSSYYGNFYRAMGESVWYFGLFDAAGNLCGGSLFVSVRARRGSFLYAPYGPIFSHDAIGAAEIFLEAIKVFAKKHSFCAVRVSPFMEKTQESIFRHAGYRQAPMHVLAERSVLVPVDTPPETLLLSMNKNHRNLIRRCEREGVAVSCSSDVRHLNDLDTLLSVTSKRHNFHRFSQSYIRKEFEAFLPSDNARLYRAYLPDGTLDSAAVVLSFGSMAVYRHSGSYGKNSKLPTSYALQWHIIQDMHQKGMRWYNMWGIAPEEATAKHPFFGITHFKKGFGGHIEETIPCMDLPLSIKYLGLFAVDSFRKYFRGF